MIKFIQDYQPRRNFNHVTHTSFRDITKKDHPHPTGRETSSTSAISTILSPKNHWMYLLYLCRKFVVISANLKCAESTGIVWVAPKYPLVNIRKPHQSNFFISKMRIEHINNSMEWRWKVKS